MGAGGDARRCGRLPAPARGPRGAVAASFAITERAESGPITAIAVTAAVPVGGGRGRACAASTSRPATTRPVGRARTTPAHARDHRHRDRRRRRRLGRGRDGVGRWVAAGDDLRYERKGTPGHGDRAGARAVRSRPKGIWAGGPGGLLSLRRPHLPQRRRLHDVPRDVARRSTTTARAPGSGTRGHGLYRADGDRAAPVPGSDVRSWSTRSLGVAKTAAGTRVAAGNVGRRGAPVRADAWRASRVPRAPGRCA